MSIISQTTWDKFTQEEKDKVIKGYTFRKYEPTPLVEKLLQAGFNKYPTSYDEETYYIYLCLAQKWLREVKGIIICIEPCFYKNKRPLMGYDYHLFNKDDGWYSHIEAETVFDSYEQSLSVGIDKALELLKEENNGKMKTTELQKKIIDICITELQCWRDSNDFTSPTHNSDGEVALLELYYDDELYSDDCEVINTSLQNLRYTILKVTKQYENNKKTDM